MSEVEKVERDGKVAVLVSPNYGAGWSTWVAADQREAALFAPDVVAWVEAGKPDDGSRARFEVKYGYAMGLDDLVIQWVPRGQRFTIDEYDGSEHLTILGPDFGHLA